MKQEFLARLLLGTCAVILPCLSLCAQTVPATQITLSASAMSVDAGKPVVLTATVTTAGSPVKRGLVSFYDGKKLLGTVPVVRSGGAFPLGTARLARQLAPGADAITAVYVGNTGYQTSHSSPVTISVGSDFPASVLLFAPSGQSGNYTIPATVLAPTDVPPTGTLELNDTTISSTQIASATLSSAQTSTAQLLTYPGNRAIYPAIGDFNGDGYLDLAFSNMGASGVPPSIGVRLGNGNGTFGAEKDFPGPSVGNGLDEPYMTAIGDFNGDGYPDLAVVNNSGSTLSIFQGDGKGDLTYQTDYGTQNNPRSLAIGDFNGDGILDIAVANMGNAVPGSKGNSVSIFLGNSDGTFAPQVVYPVGANPQFIAVADLNGDGIPDLVVSNSNLYHLQCTPPACSDTISVLIGKGDGTFESQVQYDVGDMPWGLAVADVNGDGIPDIVVADQGGVVPGTYGDISVLLGKGDGTFSPATTIPLDQYAQDVTIGDWNGDGIPDLAIAMNSGNPSGSPALELYTGNGDGTFTKYAEYDGPALWGLTSADLNGDGHPDIVANTNTCPGCGSSMAMVLLNGTISSSSATFTSISPEGSGTHTVDAVYSGDNTYLPATSQSISLQATPEFSLTPPSSPTSISSAGQSGTSAITLKALNGFTGTVDFKCELTTITGNNGTAPTCTITPSVDLTTSSSSATATLTVDTTAASTSLLRIPVAPPPSPLQKGTVMFAGTFLMAGFLRRRAWKRMVLSLLLVGVLFGLQACSGGSAGTSGGGTHIAATPAGTYSFTVTATDAKNPNSVLSTTVAVKVS